MATTPRSDLKAILRRLMTALPAGIPYAGDIYANYFNAKDIEELRDLLDDAVLRDRTRTETLLRELGMQRKVLDAILAVAKVAPKNPTEHMGLVVNQHARVIQNNLGDINNNFGNGKPNAGRQPRRK